MMSLARQTDGDKTPFDRGHIQSAEDRNNNHTGHTEHFNRSTARTESYANGRPVLSGFRIYDHYVRREALEGKTSSEKVGTDKRNLYRSCDGRLWLQLWPRLFHNRLGK